VKRGRKICDSGYQEKGLLYLDSRTTAKVGLSFGSIFFSSLLFFRFGLNNMFLG